MPLEQRGTVPAGLAVLEALKQLDCPAGMHLLLVVLETAVFHVDVQRTDHVFLVVSGKPKLTCVT